MNKLFCIQQFILTFLLQRIYKSVAGVCIVFFKTLSQYLDYKV